MLIAGAKGFAKEVMESYIQDHTEAEVVFFDDVSLDIDSYMFNKFPILRSKVELKDYFSNISNEYTLGLGSPVSRKKLSDIIDEIGGKLVSTISSKSHLGQFGIEIKEGCNLMQGVIITSNVKIGRGVLVNINSTIGHDSIIEDFVEICPGVNISGNCHIGMQTFIGTNATILPGIKIGANVTIGAGSLVTKDIPDNTMAYGIPAKPISK
ncbi:MAG: acetyltransferase [Chitinophagales bacterium]|nr:acetyltransferase [Chitinophagales bacterium]